MRAARRRVFIRAQKTLEIASAPHALAMTPPQTSLQCPLEIARQALAIFGESPPRDAQFVPGGLTHQLLRVETDEGVWALKLLSPRATRDDRGRARLERAEAVAQRARASGIAALVARRGPNQQFLQCASGRWTTLYPWIAGETLPPTAANPAQCAQIGALLGRLHALKIRYDDQAAPAPEAFERGHFAAIAKRARAADAPYAAQLCETLEHIEAANDLALRAQLELRAGWVTGHLDFDQKNVLWHAGAPTVLDWENAKPIHPALEAMGAALNWAGQSAGAPVFESFAAFVRAYLRENPVEMSALQTAVDGVLGKWVIWLEFNLERLLEPQIIGTPEAQIALDAGLHALRTTLDLREDGAMYRKWLARI